MHVHSISPCLLSNLFYSAFLIQTISGMARSLFCRSLFVLLYVFFWPLCCLFCFELWILLTHLISSNSSQYVVNLYYTAFLIQTVWLDPICIPRNNTYHKRLILKLKVLLIIDTPRISISTYILTTVTAAFKDLLLTLRHHCLSYALTMKDSCASRFMINFKTSISPIVHSGSLLRNIPISLFVLLSVFFWPLCCLFCFDLRIMITSLWQLHALLICIFECLYQI